MSRPIKFRAWDSKRNEMNHKVLVGNTCGPDDYTAHAIYIHDEQRWTNFDERSDIELMQFTGLTYKNGKEIYEGDIVKLETTGRIGPIKFGEGRFYVGIEFYTHYSIVSLEIELIGTIYENPELLTPSTQ